MNRDSPTEPSMTSPASPPLGHVFETPLRDLVGIIWGGAFSSSKSTPFNSIHSYAAEEILVTSARANMLVIYGVLVAGNINPL